MAHKFKHFMYTKSNFHFCINFVMSFWWGNTEMHKHLPLFLWSQRDSRSMNSIQKPAGQLSIQMSVLAFHFSQFSGLLAYLPSNPSFCYIRDPRHAALTHCFAEHLFFLKEHAILGCAPVEQSINKINTSHISARWTYIKLWKS